MGTNKKKIFDFYLRFWEVQKDFHNYIPNLYLASFLDFARECDQFKYIKNLTLPLTPYEQSISRNTPQSSDKFECLRYQGRRLGL